VGYRGKARQLGFGGDGGDGTVGRQSESTGWGGAGGRGSRQPALASITLSTRRLYMRIGTLATIKQQPRPSHRFESLPRVHQTTTTRQHHPSQRNQAWRTPRSGASPAPFLSQFGRLKTPKEVGAPPLL
jgi:hypothetical protein